MRQGLVSFDNSKIIEILFSEADLSVPRGITIDPSFIATNPDGQKMIMPGMLISRMSTGYGRVFPGSRVVTAVAASGNGIVVRDASIYKVGEVVRVVAAVGAVSDFAAPAAVGTIASIDLTTNTITLTAGSTSALAAGSILLGTDGSALTDIYGITVSAVDILLWINDVAAYVSASVYGARLPFWATALTSTLSEIKMVPRPNSFPVL